MTHRERFIAAVTHRAADRAVFDLCGSPQTLVDYQVTKDRIAKLLGITGKQEGNPYIDERILEAFDIDTRLAGGMPTPKTTHSRMESGIKYDSWGIAYRETNGHWEICINPLNGATLDEVMSYEFPDPDNIDGALLKTWAGRAEYLRKNTDYAVVAEHPVLGVFELGCWMFGFEDFLYRLAGEPDLVHAFFGRVLDFQKKMIEKYYGALGKFIDCTTAGDDFGTQTGPFMSTAMFDDLIKPYLKERISFTRRFMDGFFYQHSCGSVYNFIPSFIDCGVDILNPIQPGAYMMEPERLKADFGGRIAFWGGIDTQRLLPSGSVQDVKDEVKRILSIMDCDGGYILSPAHTIQYDVPAENVIAVYEAAKEYNK